MRRPYPHMVIVFLTGRPMQSREPLERQASTNDQSQNTVPPVIETTKQTTLSDPINHLAEVLVGVNNRPSGQTLMVRPVSTTILTFDVKSVKLHFHSSLSKNALRTLRYIITITVNRQTLEDSLAVFRRKNIKPESYATAEHKNHRLVFDLNTMKLPHLLEELNQGAQKIFGGNAQAMIDSLLYDKLPPKLKRAVSISKMPPTKKSLHN